MSSLQLQTFSFDCSLAEQWSIQCGTTDLLAKLQSPLEDALTNTILQHDLQYYSIINAQYNIPALCHETLEDLPFLGIDVSNRVAAQHIYNIFLPESSLSSEMVSGIYFFCRVTYLIRYILENTAASRL